ncbi:MAG: hypothetical protein MRJ65_09560 [Candidatus Brocadiaceae bacterium]|nr:hypothetical protein [Candidatus Brocadiaceae bacterium]
MQDKQNNVEIFTHLKYTELFDSFERNGIILPSSSLKTTEDLEAQIEYLLQKMNPVELIQFSSFLNMICQSKVDGFVKTILCYFLAGLPPYKLSYQIMA